MAEAPIDTLKNAVKQAISFAREQRWDDFYSTYGQLFYSPDFEQVKPDDQRRALRLMISTKGLPPPTSDAAVQAYQAAWHALNRLVNDEQNPHDYELFGLVYYRLGAEADARTIFQAGHELALKKDDAELCGAFLRHLSMF